MLVLPPSPSTNQTRELLSSAHSHLGSQCTSANCVKKLFSKISPELAESYLCNKTFNRQNKICLRNAIPYSFIFIFYIFLNLNQGFRAKLCCKSCVQLPILWKTRFSQTLGSHIYVTKHLTDKIKHVQEASILFFFIFYYFLNLN